MKKIISSVIKYIILIFLAIYTLAPLVFLFINSFKSQDEIDTSAMALPHNWDLKYIVSAMRDIHFFKALLITVLVTVLSVGIIVLVSAFSAWMLVRNNNKVSKFLLLLFIGVAGAVFNPLINIVVNILNLFVFI